MTLNHVPTAPISFYGDNTIRQGATKGATKGETMSAFIIQEREILRAPEGRTIKATRYFSPATGSLDIISGPAESTICIAEDNRSHYEAGEKVRAIFILDPLAWLWEAGEERREWTREQIEFGEVRKKS